MTEIDFWFSTGSTYTYLSMMRMEDVEKRHGVTFRLRPFYLGMIFNELERFPFVKEPQKLAYMWKDIGRRAAVYGLNPSLPAQWPLDTVVPANQVAHVALREDWGRAYMQESYRQWMELGNPAGAEPNISNSLSAVGQDPETIKAQAFGEETHAALLAETDIARSLGIFGAPSFVVEGELFWGDDRMEDAAAFAAR